MKKVKKSITLRLDDTVYKQLLVTAASENRSIANLAETLMLQKLNEINFVDDFEMQEILSNKALLKRLERGSKEGKELKGKFY